MQLFGNSEQFDKKDYQLSCENFGEEDNRDKDRRDIFHNEHYRRNKGARQGAVVGKLLAEKLLRRKPSKIYTRQYGNYRKHIVGCNSVKEIKQVHTRYLEIR